MLYCMLREMWTSELEFVMISSLVAKRVKWIQLNVQMSSAF